MSVCHCSEYIWKQSISCWFIHQNRASYSAKRPKWELHGGAAWTQTYSQRYNGKVWIKAFLCYKTVQFKSRPSSLWKHVGRLENWCSQKKSSIVWNLNKIHWWLWSEKCQAVWIHLQNTVRYIKNNCYQNTAVYCFIEYLSGQGQLPWSSFFIVSCSYSWSPIIPSEAPSESFSAANQSATWTKI